MDFNFELENECVKLRPVRRSDFDAFENLTNDQSMWNYFTSDLSDKDVLITWVDEAVDQLKAKKRLALTLIEKKQNRIIGSTSLGNISERDKRIEIGWTWIGREFQGKGFNDEVKYLLLKYCFEELCFERVELKTDVLNTYARQAMLRIGLKEEGILRSHTLMTHGRRRDTIYYRLLKDEWEQLKKQINSR
ncbi:MAG TPA: GNAT family protein [Sunxiuqinia sp.]|nr:GNAT family protein [Sunxiuqinia sp.]